MLILTSTHFRSIFTNEIPSYMVIKQTVSKNSQQIIFRERSLKKTVSCEEQITSKYQYLGVFSSQREAIVLSSFKYCAPRTVYKIEKYHLDIQAGAY